MRPASVTGWARVRHVPEKYVAEESRRTIWWRSSWKLAHIEENVKLCTTCCDAHPRSRRLTADAKRRHPGRCHLARDARGFPQKSADAPSLVDPARKTQSS